MSAPPCERVRRTEWRGAVVCSDCGYRAMKRKSGLGYDHVGDKPFTNQRSTTAMADNGQALKARAVQFTDWSPGVTQHSIGFKMDTADGDDMNTLRDNLCNVRTVATLRVDPAAQKGKDAQKETLPGMEGATEVEVEAIAEIKKITVYANEIGVRLNFAAEDIDIADLHRIAHRSGTVTLICKGSLDTSEGK